MLPGMERKRRLPLVPSDNEIEPRTACQWVGFGAIAIFVVWVPLAALAVSVTSRWIAVGEGPHRLARAAIGSAVASAFALAAAALAGGALIGTWGGPTAGPRRAALAGLVAAIVAVAASWLTLGFAPGALVVVAIAVPFAALGGELGRLRKGGQKR
jgi:hypothetical protein